MKGNTLKHAIGYATVLLIAVVGTAQALPGTNTVTSDDIVNKQVRKADLAIDAVRSKTIKNGAVRPADLAEAYYTESEVYTKAEVNALLAGVVKTTELTAYVKRSDLGQRGVLRWGRIRDLGATVEVYQDNIPGSPGLTVERTATGVYEVTVPGVVADGARHGILVSPQQGQTTVFRACKVFQTVSAGDAADTLVVRVRCYDAAAALSDSDFHILVFQ